MKKVYFVGAATGTSKEGKQFNKVTLIVQNDDRTETYTFFVNDSVYSKCEGKQMFAEVEATFMPGYQGRCNLEDVSFVAHAGAKKGTASADDFR